MPKKIKVKTTHDCRKHAIPRGTILTDIKKNDSLLQLPNQSPIEFIYSVFLQCTVCKNVYMVRIKKENDLPEGS